MQKSPSATNPSHTGSSLCIFLLSQLLAPFPSVAFVLGGTAISPSHGSWDPGLNLPALTKARGFPTVEVTPVFPYHVEGSSIPQPGYLSPLRGSSSINKAFHRDTIPGWATCLLAAHPDAVQGCCSTTAKQFPVWGSRYRAGEPKLGFAAGFGVERS